MNHCLAFILFAACLMANAKASDIPSAGKDQDSSLKAQVREEKQIRRMIAREIAPVKSLQDFYRQQAHQSRGIDAFGKLTPKSRAEFIAGLVFGERGLASFNFKVIEDELSFSEAYDLLGLFGVQYTIKHMKGLKVRSNADLLVKEGTIRPMACCDENESGEKGYRCESRGTCALSQTHICTDNC